MKAAAPPRAVYFYQGRLYVSMTNRCPTACGFCAKRKWKWDYRGTDLKVKVSTELTDEEITSEVFRAAVTERPPEIIFCGFGEPTYRLTAIGNVATKSNAAQAPRLRLNTVGLGSAIWKRDIVPELASRLDSVSVSLNTADPTQWLQLHRPKPAFRDQGFAQVQEFVRACVRAGLDTTVTAVEFPEVDLAAVRRLAADLGAKFRPRPTL